MPIISTTDHYPCWEHSTVSLLVTLIYTVNVSHLYSSYWVYNTRNSSSYLSATEAKSHLMKLLNCISSFSPPYQPLETTIILSVSNLSTSDMWNHIIFVFWDWLIVFHVKSLRFIHILAYIWLLIEL